MSDSSSEPETPIDVIYLVAVRRVTDTDWIPAHTAVTLMPDDTYMLAVDGVPFLFVLVKRGQLPTANEVVAGLKNALGRNQIVGYYADGMASIGKQNDAG